MNHSIYPIIREDHAKLRFTFESNNSLGTNPVRKMVAYVPIMRYGTPYFNLEFCDFRSGGIVTDYLAITDNGDMRKVLKTVAATLELFFEEFPNDKVHFDGSDPRRHLYYHKLIRDYYEFIVPLYRVYGCIDGVLESFKAGCEYDFIAVTKQ